MANENRSVQLSITLPVRLVERIDETIEQLHRDRPYQSVTRSGLIQYWLAEHLALLDDPGYQTSEHPSP